MPIRLFLSAIFGFRKAEEMPSVQRWVKKARELMPLLYAHNQHCTELDSCVRIFIYLQHHHPNAKRTAVTPTMNELLKMQKTLVVEANYITNNLRKAYQRKLQNYDTNIDISPLPNCAIEAPLDHYTQIDFSKFTYCVSLFDTNKSVAPTIDDFNEQTHLLLKAY